MPVSIKVALSSKKKKKIEQNQQGKRYLNENINVNFDDHQLKVVVNRKIKIKMLVL